VVFVPFLVQSSRADGGSAIALGHELLDDYLALVAARARPNTVLATAYDLKVFFERSRRFPTVRASSRYGALTRPISSVDRGLGLAEVRGWQVPVMCLRGCRSRRDQRAARSS
jgi:hypothetical protein